jgi:hypothetical protein
LVLTLGPLVEAFMAFFSVSAHVSVHGVKLLPRLLPLTSFTISYLLTLSFSYTRSKQVRKCPQERALLALLALLARSRKQNEGRNLCT